ncbi:MAG: diguanylate cyclase [Proteobacteria bacterium]|nr:diguanylate cyclase [Pseudomonadota bacterium]
MRSADGGLAERLAELRKSYESHLGEKVDAIAQALAGARDRGLLDELKRAHQLAHRLHGTAGSYGFGPLGSAAGELEKAIVAQLRDPTSDRRWSTITTALAELEQEVVPFRQRPAPEATPALSPRRSAITGPELPRVASTLLLVTRDQALRLQTGQAATQALTTVLTASDPDGALLQARTQPIDAVLLDVDPREPMATLDLARRLRRLPGRLSLPLAFLSRETSLQARVAAAHAGACLFLSRPASDQELTTAVRQLCNREARERVRVLLVDDDPHFLEVLQTVLRAERIEVHTLDDARRVVEVLDHIAPDLLLIDLMMPGISGCEICRVVRANPAWQMLPVIVVTADASPEQRIAAFEAGADDYLPKPIVTQELLARLRLRLEHARLVRERSSRDPLTGVLARRAFVEAFAARLADAQRRGDNLALGLIDLDHFKRINDRHGHLAGDRVLAAMGRALDARLRDADVRGRWGGEEFIVALPEVDLPTAQTILCRLKDDLASATFVDDAGAAFAGGFSAGISLFPQDGHNLDELLAVADRRLYAAKHAGRNRVDAGEQEATSAAESP